MKKSFIFKNLYIPRLPEPGNRSGGSKGGEAPLAKGGVEAPPAKRGPHKNSVFVGFTLSLTLLILTAFAFPFSLPSCRKPKDAGMWRSDDAGENWKQIVTIDEKNNIASENIVRIIYDPHGGGQRIYLGTLEKGMFFSDNGGDTWQSTQINKGDVWDIAIDPEDENTIYVAVFSGNLGRVYATHDKGENWEPIFIDTIVGAPVYNVVIDWYNHNNIIITTGWGGILFSEDQGQTWEKISEIRERVGRVHLSDTDSRIMWYVTPDQGILRTSDGGYNWEEIALEGLREYPGGTRIYELTIDESTGRFFIATGHGLLISEDLGFTWEPIKTLTPYGSGPFYSIAVNPQDPNEIFFATGNTVFKSYNQGETWRSRKVHTGQAIRYVRYHPENPEVIYLGIRRYK